MLPEAVDYNEEAKKLWSRLGETRSFYNNLDPIHKSKEQGFIFVGSDTAARDLNSLQSRGITAVVNCTTNISCYHLGTLDYLKFDIAGWRRHTDDKDENVKEFLKPVIEFVFI
ncbi:dual specificity protein phosphatase 10 [Eurytemora carolleeae]|uniref:dual specificity protein phosphatase 10 n=1 Tax=Eurytemora carolleeae TaxID=1294199 RepID=UPI000C78BD7E|nr:dual specificity protein phosphatase 10 [Eurytemora carolleeae]|eukprot:XP_023321571.1 dual specificity protein phosphatase 10-like [Eurytemora affinis]